MGTGSNVHLEMTGDAKRLEQELNRANLRMEGLNQKVNAVGRDAKLAAKSAEGFGKQLAQSAMSFGGVASGAALVLATMRLITAEIQKQQEMQKKAADAQIDVSSARRDIIRNMPGASNAAIQGVLGQTSQLARQTAVDEKFVAQAVAEALATGVGSPKDAIAAVRQATQFLADKPQDIPTYAGALLDLSKVTGSNDAEVNAGFLNFIGGLARVVSPQSQAQSVPKALIGMKSFGATDKEGAAIYSALTTGSGDITGRESGTASVALAEQMFFAQRGEKAFKGKKIDFGGAQTMGQRIEFLQQNRRLAEKFLLMSSFEKTSEGPIRDLLLDPNSPTARAVRSNMLAIPDHAGLAASARQSQRQFFLAPGESTAAAARSFASTEQQVLLNDLLGGQGAVTREGLQKVLDAVGQGSLMGTLQSALFESNTAFGGPGAMEYAKNRLLEEAASLEGKHRKSGLGGYIHFRDANDPPGRLTDESLMRPANEAERANAELLRALADKLQTLIDIGRANQAARPATLKDPKNPVEKG